MKKRYYFLIFIYFVEVMNVNGQLAYNDSLLLVFKTTTQDSIKVNTLNSLAVHYYDTYPDSSLYYTNEALKIAVRNNFLPKQAQLFQTMGIAYDYKGNLDSCLFFLDKALAIYKSLNLPDKQSHVISDIALAWFYRGNYELAIRNHLAAFELRKEYGNKKFISISMNNLGLVSKARKDYAAAINYYRQSLVLKEEIVDKQGILNTTMNIGSLYQSRLVYDSAFYFAEKGLKIAQELNVKKDIGSCLANMGDALLNLNRVAEAEKLLIKAEQIALPINHTQCLTTIYHAMGNIRVRDGNYPEALSYFQKGLDMSASNGRQELMQNFTDKMAETYRSLKLYDKALQFKDSSTAIAGRILNEENLRQINEMTVVYKTNEKEKQIVLLDVENKLAATEAGRSKKERNYFIAASLLFLFMAGFAYKAYVANRKKKEELNIKNLIIEKALSEKEVLLKEIHHRVKNNLQIVSSLLSLQSNYIKDEQALDAVKESRNRVESMSLIHQNLYQENNLTGIYVQQYIGNLLDNLFYSYNIKPDNIKLVKEIDPLLLDVDTVIPIGLILNELITNCLKYAFPNNRKGSIKVMLSIVEHKLILSVYDNGIGLPQDFEQGVKKSFGHKMINAFLQKLKGEMKMYSEDGTKVDIEIANYIKI